MSTLIEKRRKSGDRYGYLELLRPAHNTGKHIAWVVKCHGCGKGVRGRNSNNDLIRKVLNWNPRFTLREGLEKTYHWISQQYDRH